MLHALYARVVCARQRASVSVRRRVRTPFGALFGLSGGACERPPLPEGLLRLHPASGPAPRARHAQRLSRKLDRVGADTLRAGTTLWADALGHFFPWRRMAALLGSHASRRRPRDLQQHLSHVALRLARCAHRRRFSFARRWRQKSSFQHCRRWPLWLHSFAARQPRGGRACVAPAASACARRRPHPWCVPPATCSGARAPGDVPACAARAPRRTGQVFRRS